MRISAKVLVRTDELIDGHGVNRWMPTSGRLILYDRDSDAAKEYMVLLDAKGEPYFAQTRFCPSCEGAGGWRGIPCPDCLRSPDGGSA